MISMETYGDITGLLGFAGVFVSLAAGIAYAIWKKTWRYTWLFLCIAGFCFFTFLTNVIIMISYDDISDPNYETYKDWNTWKLILCDIKHLLFWTGVGALNYFGFIRKNRIIRCLCILGICGFSFLFYAVIILCIISVVSTHFQ